MATIKDVKNGKAALKAHLDLAVYPDGSWAIWSKHQMAARATGHSKKDTVPAELLVADLQLYYVVSGSGKEVKIPGPVATIEEATKRVEELDAKFQQLTSKTGIFPRRAGKFAFLRHWEGCDVYARDRHGDYMFDGDEWVVVGVVVR